MNSHGAVRIGAQTPRILKQAEGGVSNGAQEAIELASSVGLELDPWQQLDLEVMLAERADGKYASFEHGLVVARQNGKGSILEARELAGAFLFGEKLITHTAHLYQPTCAEAFRRLKFWIDNNDWLRKKVKKIDNSHGSEGIELLNGNRILFLARSGKGSRGMTGDVIILDEALFLDADAVGAMLPTLSTLPNPQVIYTSSAALETSSMLHRLRNRAIRGEGRRMSYLEWSWADRPPDPKNRDEIKALVWNREAWYATNPALGIRITEEYLEAEIDAAPESLTMRERLSIPDPAPEEDQTVISVATWDAKEDPTSKMVERVALGVEVSWKRDMAAIVATGYTYEGKVHHEVVEYGAGTGWVVPRLVQLKAKWKLVGIAVDLGGPAGVLEADLKAAKVEFEGLTAGEVCRAAGKLVEDLKDDKLRHLGDADLRTAVQYGKRRDLAKSWTWDREKSDTDISLLCAATWASWLTTSEPPRRRSVPVH